MEFNLYSGTKLPQKRSIDLIERIENYGRKRAENSLDFNILPKEMFLCLAFDLWKFGVHSSKFLTTPS